MTIADELIGRLLTNAKYLRKMVVNASFGGDALAITIKKPATLLEDLDDAATLLASQEAEIERLNERVVAESAATDASQRRAMRFEQRVAALEGALDAANNEVTMLVSWCASHGDEPDLLLQEFERLNALNETLETTLRGCEKPLEHASQCLDSIVSMDDEDQGKDGGSATCQAVKKTADRALKNVRAALRPAETGERQP